MKLRKTLSLLLCAVMMFSLTACNSSDYKDASALIERPAALLCLHMPRTATR